MKILCFICAALLVTQTWADGKISDDKAAASKGIFAGLIGNKDKNQGSIEEGCSDGDCSGFDPHREECGDKSVARAFRKSGVFPDLIPDLPQSYLEVWITRPCR